MNGFARSLVAWGQDRLFRRVLRNSSYLFASNVISALMVILTTQLLGVAAFGELGIITTFVANVNRLLSFRMGDVVVRYMGEHLARQEYDRAAAVVKAAGLAEAATSIAAYLVLVLVAPLGARIFINPIDPQAVSLILLYGLSILGNFATETATGVLQVTNHYRSQALVNLLQSVLVAGIIAYGFITQSGMLMVLMAYLIGKMVLGIGPILMALFHLHRLLGPGWWRASFQLLPPRRELARFALSTNFSGTMNMVVRDSEELWLGLFFTTREAGYFKIAKALINPIIMPITPFISTTYPELNRAVVTRQWRVLRDLLKRVTAVAGVWTGAVALGLLLVGRQVLFQPWSIFGTPVLLFGEVFSPLKPSYEPAFPALMVLLIGFGAANILFWNRPLLLALGIPDYPLKVAFWGTVAKVSLTILLVPASGAYGYIVEAGLLSAYLAITVGLMVWRGLASVRRAEALKPVEAAG